MGTGASVFSEELSYVPAGWQEQYKAQFLSLKQEGKSDEEASNLIKHSMQTSDLCGVGEVAKCRQDERSPCPQQRATGIVAHSNPAPLSPFSEHDDLCGVGGFAKCRQGQPPPCLQQRATYIVAHSNPAPLSPFAEVQRSPARVSIHLEDFPLQNCPELLDAFGISYRQTAKRLSLEGRSASDTQLEDKTTALLQAAYEGREELVCSLLEHGTAPNTPDNSGRTALMPAAFQGHVEVVRLLLEYRAAFDTQDKDGCTALMQAAFQGHTEVVCFLLEHGASIDIQNNDGWTALMRAAYGGRVKVVRLILDRKAASDTQSKDGSTALMWAASQGHMEVVRLLLEHGAARGSQTTNENAVLVQGARQGLALIQAARRGHVEVVRLLLDHDAAGASDTQNKDGTVALVQSAYGGHVEVVRLLLERGGAPNIQDEDGWTALMWAANGGHAKVVCLLLESNAAPGSQSKDGWTALMLAAEEGHVEVVSLLLQHGAEPDTQNKDGTTALLLAADLGYLSVCEMLVNRDADLLLQNNKGETALIKAKKRAHSDISSLLADKLGNKEEAKYLAEGRFHPVYVCERNTFLLLPRLIKCEVAIARGIVRELQPSDLSKRIAFGSHRWLRGYITQNPSKQQMELMESARVWFRQQTEYAEDEAPMEPHPDDYGNPKIQGFQRALRMNELNDVELVWMDYLCIPQNSSCSQLLAINSLPYTVRVCSDFVVLYNEKTGIKNFNDSCLDEGSWQVYNSRSWCRLECLSALAPKESGMCINAWKCSYDNGAPLLERLHFSGVSTFNPYEGTFYETSDKEKISLMVYKLGERLSNIYDMSDLASMMHSAFNNMPNKEKKKQYKRDVSHYRLQHGFFCSR